MSKTAQRVKVIIFLTVGFAVFVGMVVLLGTTQKLFNRTVELKASYSNISGLMVGSPVRLAGLDIGTVRSIKVAVDDATKEKKMLVSFTVDASALEHIRKDSLAQLSSKGLLGDMLINITLGESESDRVKPGDYLEPQEVIGLAQVAATVTGVVGDVKNLTGTLEKRVNETLTPQVAKDLGRITHSTATVMEQIEKGPGLLHTMFYEKKLADDTQAAIAELRSTAAKLNKGVEHVEQLLAAVENGDGMLHALVFEKGGGKTIHEFQRLAKELGDSVQEIRTGNGMLHTLIYEEDRTNLLQDLAAAAKLVRKMSEEVDQGKGTLGGFLKDPTIYQDLKTVLGNIKRNILLKALIRFTISKDDLKHTGEIAPQAASQPSETPAP